MDAQEAKLQAICREIFTQTRTAIVLNMRFLDMAVFRLKPTPESISLATDGERLYYHPLWLLKRYREETTAVGRDYMHVLLHCVFRHPFVGSLVDAALWDLACDIAAEAVLIDFHQPSLTTREEVRRQAVIDRLKASVHPLTAEKLYRWFQDHPPKPEWKALFLADDHRLWHSPAEARRMSVSARQREQREQREQQNQQNQQSQQNQKHQQNQQNQQNQSGQQGQQNQQNQQNPSGQQGQQNQSGQSGQQGQQNQQNQSGQPGQQNQPGQGSSPGQGSQTPQQADGQQNTPPDVPRDQSVPRGEGAGEDPGRQALEDEWRDISEHVQMDLETFAREQGFGAGDLQQQLNALNRERYNYEAFLKKFAVMGEAMKVNDDEFDYIFYTYGLKLFGNMPLIEPLEYKEVKRIREFVIAIDTSGSTSGELVQRFLTKTYNILMSTESFFSKVNLHIIQCDAQIQEAVKVTSREEFEAYLKGMTIRGLGGTDFRPVFSYVDQLIRHGEFERLKGLI